MAQWPLYSLLVTALFQFFFFLLTVIYRFDKLTDLAGTLNFVVLAVVGLVAGGSFFRRQVVLTTCVVLWGVRLGMFLFVRVLVRRKDARFDKIRDNFWRLALFWSVQILWVYIVSLPVTLLNDSKLINPPISWVDQVGWACWCIGFLMESLADYQRYRFNSQSVRDTRRKPFLDSGLWRYSRHPNYFGEILLWKGIWLSSAYGLWPVSKMRAMIAILSPLLTFLLLTFVSGIPLAEQRDDRRNHRLMAYKQYKFSTSPLIPMPPSLYARIPIWSKRWIFLDRYQLAFITPGLSRSLDFNPSKTLRRRSTSRARTG